MANEIFGFIGCGNMGGALVAADYGRVRLYSIVGALLGFALCAAGLFPPARRAASALSGMFRRIFVTIRGFRWIKVIFR